MALLAKVGSITMRTSGIGTTLEAFGVGFEPKAIIFFTGGQTTTSGDNGSQDTMRRIIGFATIDGQYSASSSSAHNQGSSICGRQQRSDCCLLHVNTGGNTVNRHGLLSMDEDGFTLEVLTQGTTAIRVHCLILGGDIDVKVGVIQDVTSQDNDITGVGFTPDLVFMTAAKDALNSEASTALTTFAVLAADGTQATYTGVSFDGVGTTNTKSYCRFGEVTLFPTFSTGNNNVTNRQIGEIISDGFRLSYTGTFSGNTSIRGGYLAIRGVNAKVGTVTLDSDDSVTGVGFEPSAGLFFGNMFNNSAGIAVDDDVFAMGAVDADLTQRAHFAIDVDNSGTSSVTRGITHDGAFIIYSSSTQLGKGTIESLDADGFSYDASGGFGVLVGTSHMYVMLASSNVIMPADHGTFSLTGQEVGLNRGFSVAAERGDFSLAGQEVTFHKLITLSAERGNFSLTGQAVDLRATSFLRADQGSFSLAGQIVTLQLLRKLFANHGTFNLTGQEVELFRFVNMIAERGEFQLEFSAALDVARYMFASRGLFKAVGKDVAFNHFPFPEWIPQVQGSDGWVAGQPAAGGWSVASPPGKGWTTDDPL